jgi:phage baseplate assembly protein W
MAYGIKKISPLDLKPSTAIGVALPFSAGNVFTSVYTTKDQLKYNIINYLLTDPRERVFNPNFGAGLRARLFEQIDQDSFEEMKRSLMTQLEGQFPQIQVTKLEIIGNPDYNSININFSYKLLRSNENDAVILTIQNS